MRYLLILFLFISTFLSTGQNVFKLPMMIRVIDQDTVYCLKLTQVIHHRLFDTLIFLFEDEVLVFHPCQNAKADRKEVIQYNTTTRAIKRQVDKLNHQRRYQGEVDRYYLVQNYFNKDRYIIHMIGNIEKVWFILFIINYDRPGNRSFILGYNAITCIV